jgi:tRNA(fMet)-specific endonuclease VapC
MIILDTDHLTVHANALDSRYDRLMARMNRSTDSQFAAAVVSVEEVMRGWLAEIHKHREVRDQVWPYARFLRLFDYFNQLQLLPFNVHAADEFERQRKQKVRIGSMDLKIACIALVHDALLLSANRRDFRLVAGLRLENWLDERKG